MKSLSVMGLDGGREGRVGVSGGQARRASQDPRHDRCSLIRNDLQQLCGASDRKNKGGNERRRGFNLETPL